MTTNLFYIDRDGKGRIADLTIFDGNTGYRCEGDILDNMGICVCGNVHYTPEYCNTDLQSAAYAADTTYYADDAEAAQWWIDYVAGANATQNDCVELREELRGMSLAVVRRIAEKYLGQNRADHTYDCDLVGKLIQELYKQPNDYENERPVFVSNLSELRELL